MKKILFIMLLICNIVIISQITILNDSNKTLESDQSKKQILSQFLFTPHTKIIINNDSDFHTQASNEGWNLGGTRDGSESLPYVIENYDIITIGESGIKVMNTRLHFVIQNVRIRGANDPQIGAIQLENVTNADLSSNDVSSNRFGIFLNKSSSNTIINNIAVADNYGMRIINTNFTNIMTNNISHNTYGISVQNSYNNNFTENYGDGGGGITLSQSSNNTLIKNFRDIGLSSSHYNQIIGNFRGLTITDSNFNTIINNTLRGHKQLVLWSSSNNTLIYNFVNSTDGILLYSTGSDPRSENNTIIQNVINGSTWGINLVNARYNYFSDNIIRNSVEYGLRIFDSPRNIFEHNFISFNDIGIFIDGNSHTNNLSRNALVSNVEYNAVDNSTGINYWYGNHYSDYTDLGPYIIPGTAGVNDTDPALLIIFTETSTVTHIESSTETTSIYVPTTETDIVESTIHDTETSTVTETEFGTKVETSFTTIISEIFDTVTKTTTGFGLVLLPMFGLVVIFSRRRKE